MHGTDTLHQTSMPLEPRPGPTVFSNSLLHAPDECTIQVPQTSNRSASASHLTGNPAGELAIMHAHSASCLSSEASLTKQACEALDIAERAMKAFTSGRERSYHTTNTSGNFSYMYAHHARDMGAANPLELTPLRSCSVYSTDPETDLARLLSPSDSQDTASEAMSSRSSSLGASPSATHHMLGTCEPIATVAAAEQQPAEALSCQVEPQQKDSITLQKGDSGTEEHACEPSCEASVHTLSLIHI